MKLLLSNIDYILKHSEAIAQRYFIKSKTFRKHKMHYAANVYSFGMTMRNDNKSRGQ